MLFRNVASACVAAAILLRSPHVHQAIRSIEKCELMLWCTTNVNAINNRGEIAGYRNGLAFRWSRIGGFVRGPIDDSSGQDINNSGDVAGAIWNDQKSTPFVWFAPDDATVSH